MRHILTLAFLVSIAYSQQAKTSDGRPQAQSYPTEYRLGPSDVLSISVVGLKDFDRQVTVSNSGRVRLPHLGIVDVLDMTTLQLEADLARRLRERNLVKDPWVQVRVTASRSQTVYVLGEVGMPGQYLLKEGMRLLDLVTFGLGLNEFTNKTVYLYRQRPLQTGEKVPAEPMTKYDATPVDLHGLLHGKNPELNLPLQGGDILYCPQKKPEFFYAVGDLLKSGPIEMLPGQTVLASRAISSAGGPTKTAKLSKGMILRYDKAGVRQELAVDFNALLRGKKPDFAIQPNDIVYIPGSSAKTLGYGLLSIVPGVGAMATVIR